ncbi:septal ring lytic transglycosylase RlpA family protein [Teichococcus oryzae]|uniref:Endolytic peptidoglycan transglycosylase RlpA n=1 Tax=Teichococcus oryzae TaxID=1608942 RepID=A0A5B2TJD3_9PROT|nr:septal ring lytic transglycosylase RlpA family protein [Pseudoroseomonas oryzae]KAA2214591.1 septal ring lytic transglycosylase RlpA family protein [Pseudoroseomonas oryzae]
MQGLKIAAICLALGLSASFSPAEARQEPRKDAAQSQVKKTQPQARKPVQRGRASYYASHFHGKRMANGKRFNRNSNAAASRTLPLGTEARVKNLENGRTAVVTIQDRGPYKKGRVLDVSPRTATLLGMREEGVAMVEITPIRLPSNPG